MAAQDNIDGRDDNGDDIETSAGSELLINYRESVWHHDITFRWWMPPLPTAHYDWALVKPVSVMGRVNNESLSPLFAKLHAF